MNWVHVERYGVDVAPDGSVRSHATVRVLKVSDHYRQYRRVNLRIGGRKTTVQHHLLIALAFIPNPENKPEVNHIDGDKRNNAIENLEWCTRLENMQHAKFLHGEFREKTRRCGRRVRGSHKGAYRNRGKWVATICVDNGKLHLGMFATKEEASAAYNTAALLLHVKPILNEVPDA